MFNCYAVVVMKLRNLVAEKKKYVLTFPEKCGLYLDFVSFPLARHTPV